MTASLENLKNFDLFEWMEKQETNRIYFKNDGLFYERGESIFNMAMLIYQRDIMFLNDFLVSQGHKEILFSCYPEVGLRSIIAIHDTTLAVPIPTVSSEKSALGGCRFYNYESFLEMLNDALKLSRAMTYKSAAAGLTLGGAKAVIWIANPKNKSLELLNQFALEIESLGGKYIGAEDANCSVQDIETMSQYTNFLTGRDESKHLKIGGMGSGSPGIITAAGIIKGMKACLVFAGMGNEINGKTVLVHGVGSVGRELCKYLRQRGVGRLMISDQNETAVNWAVYMCKIKKEDIIPADKVFETECDIYSPCVTTAGILNKETVSRLKCKIVCGATNNQLENPDRYGKSLVDRGIIYAPDYVVNAGGLINVADELRIYCRNRVMNAIECIFDRILDILMWSKKTNYPPNKIADWLAEIEIEKAKLGVSNLPQPRKF